MRVAVVFRAVAAAGVLEQMSGERWAAADYGEKGC